jgi:hypothetical protein
MKTVTKYSGVYNLKYTPYINNYFIFKSSFNNYIKEKRANKKKKKIK